MTERKILLIDGSSLAFRAFFSILDIERFKNKAGLHTNALYSFNRMLDNVLTQFEPTHVLVAFDKSETTFRTEQFAEYKAGRDKTPSEFKEQMPYFRVLLDGYGIRHYEILRYEADDIIGTLARAATPNDQVIVLSGDKDLIQLANDYTTVYITRRGVSELEAYTPAHIKEKYGITPEQVIELKGLMGDSSDNYPGITRIGEKTALKLLYQFGTVAGMYERLDELKPSKMKENIVNDRDNAFLSRDLAEIMTDAPIEISLDDIVYHGRDVEALTAFYQQMEFNSFLSALREGNESANEQADSLELPYTVQVLEHIEAKHLPTETAIYFETLEDNYHFAPIIAVAWYDGQQQVAYMVEGECAFQSDVFKEWLAHPNTKKIVYDYKRDKVLASLRGVDLSGVIFDNLIAAYLVDTQHAPEVASLANMAQLPYPLLVDETVYGKGAKIAVPNDIHYMAQHLASKVHALWTMRDFFEKEIEQLGMKKLYEDVEFPLADVLAQMEIRGVAVDRAELSRMNQSMLVSLAEIEARIQSLAGEKFNINSTKQLGEILFEKLGLPAIKKTKTGYSTAADVLEKLQHQHPIIEELLNYRQLSKLQGTYLAGLPKYIKADGKIHTRFVQTLTQTGRLSSTDPNLQNIPIRMEEGRKIRQAFIPSHPEWQLFGADYSQIELRVLAHISGDEHMRQAFMDGEDIHAATARRVFGLPEEQPLTHEHRRQAKAVNFGIVYGISDYGLSQNLNISRKSAKQFIDRYFEKYPGVSTFMHDIVKEARQNGYVSTLFHRRRYLPDLHSSNFNIRSFAERTAINSPIQGTAADIIKIAMVTLQKALDSEQLEARLLLQVHDELILEAPKHEMERLSQLVPEVMEQAIQLAVPLKVDYESGNNWYELK